MLGAGDIHCRNDRLLSGDVSAGIPDLRLTLVRQWGAACSEPVPDWWALPGLQLSRCEPWCPCLAGVRVQQLGPSAHSAVHYSISLGHGCQVSQCNQAAESHKMCSMHCCWLTSKSGFPFLKKQMLNVLVLFSSYLIFNTYCPSSCGAHCHCDHSLITICHIPRAGPISK